MQSNILIIDDEKNIAFVISAMLTKEGFKTYIAHTGIEAYTILQSTPIDVVVTDLCLDQISGMDILEHCKKQYSAIPVVIITAFGTIESAVSALKKGAFDFITKPFEQTELLSTIKKAAATYEQRKKEPIYLEMNSDSEFSSLEVPSIIGSSTAMQEIFRVIKKISHSPSTVLILGESGTGKELVAYEIHKISQRHLKPFIKINCAAVPTTLIESELFGHEKGAFTGAVNAKPGKFELAHEGTLFLDEIGEMPLEMQAKLLRALQEQEFERVGGLNTIKVDVRIIAATNKDLESEVKAGKFREDLFYRLNVIPLNMPTLRERKEDIDLLVAYFINRFNEKLKKSITGVTRGVLSTFKSSNWPGNIRQLENVLERMILMSEKNVLDEKDLPEELQVFIEEPTLDAQEPLNLKEIVKKQTHELEKTLIEKALEETAGNVTRSAEKLGISRKGLQLKIKELGIKK